MRWEGRERSTNVEDRRGMKGPAMVGGGGIMVVIIGAIIAFMMGKPPQQIMQDAGRQIQQQQVQAQAAAGGNDALIARQAESQEFSEVVLKDTEDVWNRLFPEVVGKDYQDPVLVFFDGNVSTQGCGSASSAVGPFYCPGDMKVYLDRSFFDELQTKFGAPGDFACAYVIAHEVGHHIQNQLGISMDVQRRQARMNKVDANRESVRTELQADFLAGVWAHHAQKMKDILDPGDIGEALKAANQIGDDTLQKAAAGRVVPDAFTHGSAEQRIRWFSLGLESGDMAQMGMLFELDYEEL
ncbi:MAG: neutral zinc metallopeptidase [Pirellulaceae bacterium]